MKIFIYLKYFFYLAYNWNIGIAWHIIRQEIKGEKKYCINTTGADELHKLEKQGVDISHATIYMPVSYILLEEIFEQLKAPQDPADKPLNPELLNPPQNTTDKPQTLNHFLDIGCGKGRALCVAAHQGFKSVTGLDFARDLCEAAKKNLNITKQKIPVLEYKIINNDAFYFEIPDDVDCIFFFNPFDEFIMSAVVNNICTSLQNNPRNINIIYVNPLHKEFFLKAGFKETWYSKKMKYLEVVILENL
jgi:SAM-dependent methyltransferase